VLKVAVLLPGHTERLGEYLADARALETAGAAALWLDQGTQDPWMLAAALATVTSRARLGVSVAAPVDVAALAPRLRTLDALSRGRAEVHGPAVAARQVAALARSSARCRVVCRADEVGWTALGDHADAVVLSGREPEEDRARLARVRAMAGDRPSPALECWVHLKLPPDHAGWRRMCAAYEAAGADGLVVPADDRLVDLLRRFEEEDDRSDLTLAQG
jgi:hypothetical protein